MNERQMTLRESVRALPRGAWVLFFGTFLNKFGTFVLPYLAIYLTRRLGYSAAQASLAFAAYRMSFNAGWAFGPATAGLLAKKSFVWLFVGDAVTSVLFGLVAWVALPTGLRGTRVGNALGETLRVIREDRRFRQVLLASL